MTQKNTIFFFILLLFSCGLDQKPQAPVVLEQPLAAVAIEPEERTAIQSYHKHNSQKVITGFHSPESVATDGTYFYVSNVGLELLPSEKDGDGFISKLDADGNVLTLKWIDNHLDAPKGMAIVDNIIYTADIDKLKGFDLDTRKKIFELDFKKYGTVFLNDITIKDRETIFVSATDIGYIFEVSLYGSGSYDVFDIYGDLTGVNGLHFDLKNNRLLMAGFGIDGDPVGMLMETKLDTIPMQETAIGEFQGYLDGIQLINDQYLLFSDWKDFEKGGYLMCHDLNTKMTHPVLPQLISGPADFLFVEKTNMLWLPAMADGELIIAHLEF